MKSLKPFDFSWEIIQSLRNQILRKYGVVTPLFLAEGEEPKPENHFIPHKAKNNIPQQTPTTNPNK